MTLRLFLLLLLIGCNKGPSAQPAVLECGGGGEFSCPQGMFCRYETECGGVDSKGICTRVPGDCKTKESFVCGCNGRTYSNECMANAAKVSVDYIGECISKEENKTDLNQKKFDFPSTKVDIDPTAVENAGDRVEQQYEDSLF